MEVKAGAGNGDLKFPAKGPIFAVVIVWAKAAAGVKVVPFVE